MSEAAAGAGAAEAAAAGDGAAAGAPSTGGFPEEVTTLAFGSCNHQHKSQPMWQHIAALTPQAWVWTGDAVYSDVPGTLQQVHDAYNKQLSSQQYKRFLATGIPILGCYDDHDYGVNDAGAELAQRRERMDAFLDFIGASADDPRRRQNALYTSHTFGPPGRQVKVILMDTRTQRDPFLYVNVAGRWPVLQALWRLLSGKLCIGAHNTGDMLGPTQWGWLRRQLEDSPTAFHIIVSTVQVLTSNPLPESWGHFPVSQRRLLELLEDTKPRGTMLVSGDVHLSELISGVLERGSAAGDVAAGTATRARPVLEVTSSGLTHSCAGKYGVAVCDSMLRTWSQHRPHPEAFWAWENFGSVSIDWGGCETTCGDGTCAATATFNVHNANSTVVLSTRRSSCDRWSLGAEGMAAVPSILSHDQCVAGRATFTVLALLALLCSAFVTRRLRRRATKLE